jgi:predicted  nucleic acid-binding Zn-ribbon protein
MPNIVTNLVVDRVDLVDEGCNTAAFIELYKRKEQGNNMDAKEILEKMKPEHADIIKAEMEKAKSDLDAANEAKATLENDMSKCKEDLDKANEDLAKAKEDLEAVTSELETLKSKQPCDCEDAEYDEKGVCKSCGRTKKAAFDEDETLKGLPAEAKALFEKMKAQKEAAETQVREAEAAKRKSDAVAKAAELKSLPVENDKLVEIIMKSDEGMLELLGTINAALDGVVLSEVGKNAGQATATSNNAWDKIEALAVEKAKAESVTKQKAITLVIKENPELYKEYLSQMKD